MDRDELSQALSAALPQELADDLADEFLEIRRDVATRTLGRASPGKFVETVVQALQSLENAGKYDSRPKVDAYLQGLESRSSSLPDGLRICAGRLCRAMYALRSKRNIVHKADVDVAAYDLQLLYSGAQWVLAELLALSGGIGGEEAAQLVSQIQLPAGELVEALDDRKLVQGSMTVEEEALVVLMAYHPDPVGASEVIKSMDRRSAGSVRNSLSDLWKKKHLHRSSDRRVVLTGEGLRAAIAVAQEHVR